MSDKQRQQQQLALRQRQLQQKPQLWSLLKQLVPGLLDRLVVLNQSPQRILVLGLGGDVEQAVQQQFSDSQLVLADCQLAALPKPKGFLRRRRTQSALLMTHDQLALAQDSVDMVVAVMLPLWFGEMQSVFSELLRCLSPNGLLHFVTLGPDALQEWRTHLPATIAFPDMHDVGDAMLRAGFSEPVMDVEYLNLAYRTESALHQDLRAIGLSAQPGEFVECLTLELVYGHAWAPAQKHLVAADKSGVANIPISHIMRKK